MNVSHRHGQRRPSHDFAERPGIHARRCSEASGECVAQAVDHERAQLAQSQGFGVLFLESAVIDVARLREGREYRNIQPLVGAPALT